ncbi:uncharacterized protein K441DRAFT_215928 [Cenococcum geophilum 1.58]|uniref:uncharacterized protein n=1 Tax=Cenococcum geophilum 1.58 TaxID=794803 RepID=UPI00358FDD17|nr:hypothetical protein K441DRAFT_215928 [Cenococcum geophilum 1.58]
MQSLHDPRTDLSHTAPLSTPLPSTDENLLFPLASVVPAELDPLVTQTAKKLTEVINDFKRQLDERDGYSANVQGSIEMVINSTTPQTYILSLVHDLEGEEHPISVNIAQKKGHLPTDGHLRAGHDRASADSGALPSYKPTARESDSVLEQDIISRRKRKISTDNDEQDESASLARKCIRISEGGNEDIMPPITKHELEELFTKQREDIHEDTTECVNHVQRLLRRWREQWREKNGCELGKLGQLATQQGGAASKISYTEASSSRLQETPASVAGIFATSGHDGYVGLTNLSDTIGKEVKQLSNQVRWVEECRRIASDAHDEREETWRTSSAAFHDKNRQDRESFEKRALNESAIQRNMLSQILTEVKTLASVAFSLKWETPAQFPPSYPPQLHAPFSGQDQGQAQREDQGQNINSRS